MKTHKRFLALLLALALTFSLSACVSLPTKKSTISRMTTTVETGTETDSSAFSLSYEYDERGLASAIELTMDEELMGDDQKLRMEPRSLPSGPRVSFSDLQTAIKTIIYFLTT